MHVHSSARSLKTAYASSLMRTIWSVRSVFSRKQEEIIYVVQFADISKDDFASKHKIVEFQNTLLTNCFLS